MQGVERQALDGLFGARGPRFPHPKIIIVVVDNESVARANQWPLPRRVYAQAIRELKRNGARVIAIDALFPTLSERPQEDKELAAACREAGNVVQAMAFHTSGGLNSPLPVSLPGERGSLEKRFTVSGQGNHLNAVWVSAALLPLRKSSKALGHVTVFPEPDGTLRRVPHLIRYRDSIYPSLGLAAAASYAGLKPNDLRADKQGLLWPQTQDSPAWHMPLDRYGEAIVNWIGGNGSFPTFSMNELLDGRVRRSAIEGSLVFIGVTAAGAYEQRATPFSPNQPAVELQANAANDILLRRSLNESSAVYRFILLVVCAILGGLAATRLGWGSVLGFIGLCLVVWFHALFALHNNVWVPVATPLFAAAIAWIVTTASGYRQEWEENWRTDAAMAVLARGGALLSTGNDFEELRGVIGAIACKAVRAEQARLIFEGEEYDTLCDKNTPSLSVPLPHRTIEADNTRHLPGLHRGGILWARRATGSEPFKPRDAALLATIAEQASLALANLEYYELLRGEIELADENLVRINALLAEQGTKLTAAVEGIPTALIMSNENGDVIFCNSACTSVLRDAMPPLGVNLISHLRDCQLPEMAAICEKALSLEHKDQEVDSEHWRCESHRVITSENGAALSHVIFEAQLTPLRGEGEFLGLMLSVADVTAQRDVDLMKSEFVSFVAHELRSPLTSILGYASLLQTSGDRIDKENRNNMTAAITRQGTRLNRLIGELLDISRIESGKALDLQIASLDLAALCREVVEEQSVALSGRKNYELLFDGPEHLVVQGDSDRLEQVLVNLISNAVKYSPDGGRIFVELEGKGHAVVMRIKDSGMGMTSEQVASLFQKYYRTPDARRRGIKGTGLGLYLVHQLIEAHEGTIEVQSAPMQGTTFTITLPQNNN
jgi:signal transduction histidine kinase/CHASE2 domain-containing sensor protein